MCNTTSIWYLQSKVIRLSSNEIHVWRTSLDMDACGIHSLHQTLSKDEQQRAALFHFQKDREHFIVARGLLREILSRYLDQKPNDISFCYNQHGKPALHTHGQELLHFNISHSHGLALYAITSRPIGVDIERIRTNFPHSEIAEKFFSPQENAMLRSLPPNLQPKAFFTCWTRKEAYIKATGKGLSIPLNQFEVSLLPGPAVLLSIKNDIEAASHWLLQDLNPGPDYVAALAIKKHDWQLKYWTWAPL